MRQTWGSNKIDFAYDYQGRPYSLTYNGTTYYYVLNLQGDVVRIADASGAVQASYTYAAWGNVLSAMGTLADVNPLRYRGYVYDGETGLYYLNSRYYDPANRRFVNTDSYLSTGSGIAGHNMFSYCSNNPANLSDIDGTFALPILPVLAVITFVALTVGLITSQQQRMANSSAKQNSSGAIGSVSGSRVQAKTKSSCNQKSYTVYTLSDPDSNKVEYVGRTCNPKARVQAHKSNPARKDLKFNVICSTLSKDQVRGLEQSYMLFYHTLNTLDKKNNQINGIAASNKRYNTYMTAALNWAIEYGENLLSNEILNALGQ